MTKLSPMMTQYMNLKETYKDSLLFFRLGDFYELFFDDAILVSDELDLTLTGRNCGLEERAPMCGVPHHAVDVYINRLIKKGYKVAICEQTTLPEKGKSLVERDVVRIVTPGTIIEGDLLDDKQNNYIVSIYKSEQTLGIAMSDVSTGTFSFTSINDNDLSAILYDELARINPAEIIIHREIHDWLDSDSPLRKAYQLYHLPSLDLFYEIEYAQALLGKHFPQNEWITDPKATMGICAAGALLRYLGDTQKNALMHINELSYYEIAHYMSIDNFTRKSLELTKSIRNNSKKGSLLWVIDKTVTAMGGRKIKSWLDQPLLNQDRIVARQEALNAIIHQPIIRQNIHAELRNVKDMERLVTKLSYGTITPRECLMLRESIEVLPTINGLLDTLDATLLQSINQSMDPLSDIHDLLQIAIHDEPPITLKDGGVIKDGYSVELDQLRDISINGKALLDAMEEDEKEATGIKNLRIRYNRVFGYFIEVTKSNIDLVPYRYTRKQTLANAERYITPELKELEENILGAQDKAIKLETDLFTNIKTALQNQIKRLQTSADMIANLDALLSLANVAIENNYVCPNFNHEGSITIHDGRHPVVELSSTTGMYVPNDTYLDEQDERFIIITGPNMSGKSTYLRQVALITIMAHIGSYVPASSANISITDKVFSRVGASDDLFMGMSTFMVEMSEVAYILKNATKDSLIILDEIGRGTSTVDGLSLAWSVVEYICDPKKIGAKSMFATHYHQLSELEGHVQGLRNYCVSIKEYKDEIIFLRKIIRGGTDKSFGIHVAKLAGLPDEVLTRGEELLRLLEDAENYSLVIGSPQQATDISTQSDQQETAQITEHEVIVRLKRLDITQTSPIEAFLLLNELKEKL